MDNVNLLLLIEDLLADIEYCFDVDDSNTNAIYNNKKDLTLFEFLEENKGNGCVGLYSFYQNYKRIKTDLEFIKRIESFEIIRVKAINSIEKIATKSFIRNNCKVVKIIDSQILIVIPTKFLFEVAMRQKTIIEKAFSKAMEKPMIVEFILKEELPF